MLLLDVIGENRMRNNLDLRQSSVELEQTARHVIPGGYETQVIKTLAADPLRRLLRIAEGIVGLMAEHDAAERPVGCGGLGGMARNAQQIVQIDLVVDAGDEELAAFPLAEKVNAALEAQAAAGQHDNGVGRRRPRVGGRRCCKPHQPAEP